MPMGIDAISIVRFLMQAGAAVLGAASLWGIVFSVKARAIRGYGSGIFQALNRVLLLLSSGAFLVLAVSWGVAYALLPVPAEAHEGISISPTVAGMIRGLTNTAPLVVLIGATTALSIGMFYRSYGRFVRFSHVLFGMQFAVATLYMGWNVGSETMREAVYFFFHDWHSILTVGTVIVVDVLYVATLPHVALRRALYRFYPVMTGAIWVGLGLDFATNTLVFDEAFRPHHPQFLFTQMVTAVIIINGALLSERISGVLMRWVRRKSARNLSYIAEAPGKATMRTLGLSGSVSVVSWLSITFLDFVDTGLPFGVLTVLYACAILFALAGHRFIERRVPAAHGW